MFSGMGKKFYIDPYQLSEVSEEDKADYVLLTHSHYDHCSVEDIKKIVKSGTVVICPADVQSKMRHVGEVEIKIVEPGTVFELVDGLKVEAVSAYNTNKQFHEKEGGWVGVIVDFNGVRVYHAGDSDMIPEMKGLNVNVALLPVSGTYVMDSGEAVNAVALIRPELAIPMHFGSGIVGTNEDAEKFLIGCRENGVRAEILEKE